MQDNMWILNDAEKGSSQPYPENDVTSLEEPVLPLDVQHLQVWLCSDLLDIAC